MRSDIIAVTFFLSVLSAVWQVSTSFISFSFDLFQFLAFPFTCNLYSQCFSLLLSVFISFSPSFVLSIFFSPLFCLSLFSPCSTALCLADKLLFASREWDCSLVLVCVLNAYSAAVEDIPQSYCPILQHKHSLKQGPLTHQNWGHSSPLQERAALIN